MQNSRFITGIDLGTSNIAVSYIDTEKSLGKINKFKIPQLTALGELGESELLPSVIFMPDEKLSGKESIAVPWNKKPECIVGIYAGKEGPSLPTRFISSAKSWLCHAGVNRRDKILPWGSSESAQKKSPVEAARIYLEYVKNAWDHKFGKMKDAEGLPCVLAEQQTIITVPASFDETARELTLEAAKEAGLKHVSLLEEPLAAFYAWLSSHNENWNEKIEPGEKALVIDVGGGTTDFSLIELDKKGLLNRTAAGERLLLGGDNIDMALARLIEKKWKIQLAPDEWTQLCLRTKEAKEKILSENAEKADIVLLGKGSSVIASSRKAVLERKEVLDTLREGFFPGIPKDSPAPRKKIGIQTMGLPYAPESEITKYLLDFLKYAAKAVDSKDEIVFPDKILFNGGAMAPQIVRKYVSNALLGWFPEKGKPETLKSQDLSLAVSTGAAYYGLARRGEGVRIKSGTSRSYYIQAQDGESSKHVCVIPRGFEEGAAVETPLKFHLETNRSVTFPLFSSSTRTKDKPGDFVEDGEDLSPVSTLVSVLKMGKGEKKASVDAEIFSELTETGVLKIWLQSLKNNYKWPLNFDIRQIGEEEENSGVDKETVIDSEKIENALSLMEQIFNDASRLPSIMKSLEQALEIKRKDWPLHVLRTFSDALLEMPYKSLRNSESEARWLNLCGFCLRPGFGEPTDDLRVKKAWQIWSSGLNNPNNPQAVAEWWIFWRRLAPGLGNGHQRSIYETLRKIIFPKDEYSVKAKNGAQAKMEMWRCAASLERLRPEAKITMGNILADRCDRLEAHEFWALARFGSRRMFRASPQNVVPPKTALAWLKKIMSSFSKDKNISEARLFALSRIAAKTGERHIDMPPVAVEKARQELIRGNALGAWIVHLEKPEGETLEEQGRILGDALPLGLKIQSQDKI
jgi:hypothetical protein